MFKSLLFSLLAAWSCAAAGNGIMRVEIKCLDGQSRALGIYVPPQYSSGSPAPLFIWLHGGVNRPEKERGVGAVGFFVKQAAQAGIICAAPSGERGATWFDNVGFNNIEQCYRYMTANFRIDTNNIYVGGSSDGATACYLVSMKKFVPRIKGFVICSGFPGILEQVGVTFDPSYFKQYRWYIIHTGKDHLYPLEAVRKYVAAMKGAGVSVVFREYVNLPHGLEYAEKENPRILTWMGLKKKTPGNSQ